MSRVEEVAVVLLIGLVSFPAVAHAVSIAKPPSLGPALSGRTAIWAESHTSDGGFRLRTATRNAPPSTLGTFAPPGLAELQPELAASPTRIVLAYGVSEPFDNPWGQRSVLTAPVGASFEQLDSGCQLYGDPDLPRAVDVSGQVVAYPRCKSDGRTEVVVRDYSKGPTAPEQIIPGGRPHGLRVAGRFVAWLTSGTSGAPYNNSGIDIYDRLLGAPSYKLSEAAMPGAVHNLDLQDDGKVSFSFSAGLAGIKVAWASPAEPRAHILPLPGRESYEVRIAADRIGYEAGKQAFAGELTLANVGVADLRGRAHRVGNLGEGSLFTDDFDFDGVRLAWWSYGCTKARVQLARADGPPLIRPARSRCALRFTRAATTTSGDRVRLHIDCFGFPLGVCDARHVSLAASSHGRRVVIARGSAAEHVFLTSFGRRLLRNHRRLRVRAHATLSDDAGRRERRTGPLLLLRL